MITGHKGAGKHQGSEGKVIGHKGAGEYRGNSHDATGHKGAGDHLPANVTGNTMMGMINNMKNKGLLQKKAPLGSGERFHALETKLAKRPGVTSPGGLAAYIGRKSLGKARFQKLAAKGKPGY